jgi:hypothetical protein
MIIYITNYFAAKVVKKTHIYKPMIKKTQFSCKSAFFLVPLQPILLRFNIY